MKHLGLRGYQLKKTPLVKTNIMAENLVNVII